MADAGNWCLIESDPGVFTDLIQKFGVEGAEVEEIWSLDDDSFTSLRPVHGLIFLFKWRKPNASDESNLNIVRNPPSSLFFAKQVINNACATQAILSVLLNTTHQHLKIGSTLSEFKDFTKAFDPALRGLALTNCDVIRNVHNSFARQTLFEFDQSASGGDEDTFHFVSYVPHEDKLYELDGLKNGPIDLGALASGEDWLEKVKPIIRSRMLEYSTGEIHFNLLAIVSDKKMLLDRQLTELEAASGDNRSTIAQVRLSIADEEAKRARWKVENIRRSHNYLPLIVNMLQMLAQQDKLMPLYQVAKEKATAAATKAALEAKNKSSLNKS